MDITLTVTLPIEDAQRVLALLGTAAVETIPRAAPPPLEPAPKRTVVDMAIIRGDAPPPLAPEVKAKLDAALAPAKEAVATKDMALAPVPPKKLGRPKKSAPKPKEWVKVGVPEGMDPEAFTQAKNMLKAQLFAIGHIRGMDWVQQVMNDWGGGKLSQVPFECYEETLNAAMAPAKGWPAHPEEITVEELTNAMATGAEIQKAHEEARAAKQAAEPAVTP